MGLIETASGRSVWRGVDYYERDKVKSCNKVEEGIYKGKVSGSNDAVYDVYIDKYHPRKSTCSCPFADGRRVVCKHMIALFFTAEPEEYDSFLHEVEAWEEEEEQARQEYYDNTMKFINSLSKEELREELFRALMMIDEMGSGRW